MKRTFAVFVGLTLLLMVQTMIAPMWLPLGFVPDLLLLTIVLVGFWRPGNQAFWMGLLLGLFQGWMHSSCWWAFALSRSFAGILASWMRVQWLWQSPPASGFCAAVSTVSAETILALLLALSERSFTPLALLLHIGAFEAAVNAVLGFTVSHLFYPKEARV